MGYTSPQDHQFDVTYLFVNRLLVQLVLVYS